MSLNPGSIIRVTNDILYMTTFSDTCSLNFQVYMQELKETLKISPSEKSYHALAHGCKRQKQGLSLLDEMKV